MRVLLEEKQLNQIVGNYLENVENIKEHKYLYFTEGKDEDNNKTLLGRFKNDIDIGGVKTEVWFEIDQAMLYEIFNYYLGADYDIQNISHKEKRTYVRYGDYTTSYEVTVEFEPVKQKVRSKEL